MRKFYISIIIAIVYSTIIAQVPESFNYQVIHRDGGSIYPEQEMNVRINILSVSSSESSVYTKTFNPTTISLGLLNLQIVEGTPVSGTFSAINRGKIHIISKLKLILPEQPTKQVLQLFRVAIEATLVYLITLSIMDTCEVLQSLMPLGIGAG